MKVAEDSKNSQEEQKELPLRLCSEIQLFDLCELDNCDFKDGRFCTNPEMLASFEAVAEPEDRQARYIDEVDEETEEDIYSEEFDEDDDDDDGYSVFDDEDSSERNEEW